MVNYDNGKVHRLVNNVDEKFFFFVLNHEGSSGEGN